MTRKDFVLKTIKESGIDPKVQMAIVCSIISATSKPSKLLRNTDVAYMLNFNEFLPKFLADIVTEVYMSLAALKEMLKEENIEMEIGVPR